MNDVDVVALVSFQKAVKKLFSQPDIDTLIEFLSAYPEKGDVIPDTGALVKEIITGE